MAYVLSDEEEALNKEGQEQQGTPLGAESGIITGDEQKQNQGATNGTGNYTNLQSYLDQNKQANFGEKFSNTLGDTIKSAEQGQKATEQSFKDKVNQSTILEDKNVTEAAANAPRTIVNDQNKLAQFRRQQNARYAGPTQLSDEQTLYNQAYSPTNKAVSEAGEAQTEGGKKALLNQYYGAGAGRYDYTSGQSNLDRVLLGMDPNTRSLLEQQKDRAEKAQNSFGMLQSSLNDYAKEKKGVTNEARENTNNALGRAIPAWQESVQNRVNKQIQGRDENIKGINEAIRQRKTGSLTDSDWELLGLDKNQPLYGIGKEGGVLSPNLDANLQTLATPEEYDISQAYATLANQPDTFLTGKSGTGPLYSPNQNLGELQQRRAQEWEKVKAGQGDSENLAKWNMTGTGLENPWVASHAEGYNIFDQGGMDQIKTILEGQNYDPQTKAKAYNAIEARKKALMDKYGVLDYALEGMGTKNLDKHKIGTKIRA